MRVEGPPPLRAGRLLTAQSAGVSWPESGTPQMGAAGGLAAVQRLELCSGKWGPRVGQLQVPRRGVSEGGWSEEGEAGMGSQRCEQGLSAHPLSVDSRRGVCGRLGRPGVGVCIGATAGAGSVTDRGGGRGGAAAGNGAGVQDPAGSSPAGAGTRAPSWPGLLTRQLLVFVDGICRRGNLLPITENSMFGLTWEPTKVSSA